MRIGFGYDVHRLVQERPLILGGVRIPYDKGLLGHSDGDVLTHAIMDALLGAAGAGDIGGCFPDSDPQYLGADSLLLLERVAGILSERGLVISNIDGVVVAQAPKVMPFADEMKSNLAAVLGVAPTQINIKATTTEGLGFTGTGEGMAAYAVTILLPTGLL